MSYQRILSTKSFALFLPIAFAALPSCAEVIAAISKSEGNASAALPESYFPCAGSSETCTGTGPNYAFVSDTFTNAAQFTTASAFGMFGVTNEARVRHPHARLDLTDRGSMAIFGDVKTSVLFRDSFVLTPKSVLNDGVEVQDLSFRFYDRGVMSSPPNLKITGAGHTVYYDRRYTVLGVHDSLSRGISFAFTKQGGSQDRYFTSVGAGQTLEINNTEDIEQSATFYLNAPTLVASNGGPGQLVVDYEYSVALYTDKFAFHLDPNGTARGMFGNTSGLASIALYDSNGTDVTNQFTVADASGNPLFVAVPEPSTAGFVALTLVCSAFSRKARCLPN